MFHISNTFLLLLISFSTLILITITHAKPNPTFGSSSEDEEDDQELQYRENNKYSKRVPSIFPIINGMHVLFLCNLVHVSTNSSNFFDRYALFQSK